MDKQATPTRPNILLITSDQQHFTTLGVLNPHIKTPNLDRLARAGMNFTRAYTNSPVCTPSRSTIITGQYPSWHGAWTIGVQLPEDVPTVGQSFMENGYDTTLVGKAHFHPLKDSPGYESFEKQPTLRDLDFWRNFEKNHCPWYGFEHVETCRNHADESHAGGHYAIWMEEQGLKNWQDYFCPAGKDADLAPIRRAQGRTWALPEKYHYTAWTGQRTLAHIERCHQEKKPFFLWSSFHDPHPPYLVPEPWASMYDPADMPIGKLQPGELELMCPLLKETQKEHPDFSQWQDEEGYANHGFKSHLHDEDELRKDMAIYYGMISFMDHQIGKMLDKLDELGIADNTLVVFSTDHGHFLGQHGLVAKAFMYEDNVRVPFLARWPGKIKAGGTTEALQGLIDLPTTFLSAAGIAVPGRMQGVNQLPVWKGEQETVREDVIVEHRHQTHNFTARTYVNENYKLTLYKDRDWGELFDLKNDPGELYNRWNDPAYQAIKAELYHAFLNAEMRREPTRMPRVWGA